MARDPDEILPFCMRCQGIGAGFDSMGGFCHQCGSEGTCIPMKRKDIIYLNQSINARASESNALIPVVNVIRYLTMFNNAIVENDDSAIDENTVTVCNHIIKLIIGSLEDYKNGKTSCLTEEPELREQENEDDRFAGIL